jgi:predicted dehydrogenase
MISNFHAKAIADIEGASLVACFDAFPKSAERLAGETGCTAYDDLAKMLADPKVDIVTICTPSGAHMEPAVMAAEAGKHVIVEKPLEITLDRCDAIINACEKSGVVLSAIFPSRFHESSKLMKEAVESNRFGKLTMGDSYVKWFRTQEYYDSGAWRGTWKLDGGGALMNQAIHSVDLLAWLMGPVASVTAQTDTLAHERIAVEDVCAATVRFENGAIGVIQASTAAYPGYLKRIELHGTGGSAVLEEEDIKVWDFEKSAPSDEAIKERMAGKTQTGGGASDPNAIGHHGHTEQFTDVIRAIESGGKAVIDGHEGRRSVEIILAIYAAAEAGTAIELPLKSDPVLKAREKDQQA